MGKKLVRYILGMHRSSDIEGVFVLTDAEMAMVQALKGFEVYYGEIAGKHSEVRADLHPEHIEVLSDQEEVIAFFENLFPHGTGFPFKNYWFDTAHADDAGSDAACCYETPEQALAEDYQKYDNGVMRPAFLEGFRLHREHYGWE